MKPDEFCIEIVDLLKRCQGGWVKKLEEQGSSEVLLRGFYICADYGNLDSESVFFCLSANGYGEELPPWAVEGYLRYALRKELFGLSGELDDG